MSGGGARLTGGRGACAPFLHGKPITHNQNRLTQQITDTPIYRVDPLEESQAPRPCEITDRKLPVKAPDIAKIEAIKRLS
jgi:hypothetical protein